MKKLSRFISLLTLPAFLLTLPVPVHALRPPQDVEGLNLVRAGLEEGKATDLLPAIGIRRMSDQEVLRIPTVSVPSVRDRYLSLDGRVFFFRKGDHLTIQMSNLSDGSRMLIQEGSEQEGLEAERRLTVSVQTADGASKELFDWSDPEQSLPSIRSISYTISEQGPELVFTLDPRVKGVTPKSRWEERFSAWDLQQVKSPPKEVRISFRSAEEQSPAQPAASPPQPVKASSAIGWAGDLPLIQAVHNNGRTPVLSVDLHAPKLTREALAQQLELILVAQGNGASQEFPIPQAQRQFGEGWYGVFHNNYRVRMELPAEADPLLKKAGHLRFWFRYRLQGEPEWKDTSENPKGQNGIGEIVYQPDWLFQTGLYTVNVKAWGSLKAIQDRLPQIKQVGAKVILLQGIHPGHTAFEIDDYEGVDRKIGGKKALRALLREGKKMDLRFVIPFVPGHSSPFNKLLQQQPDLYYRPPDPSKIAQDQLVTVNVGGKPEIFFRGNVFPEGKPAGEIKGGFGTGTVQFDLWDPQKRQRLADYWEKVLKFWAWFGIDGFYADTGHSIHRVAPGWLEEIQRRVRMEYPNTVFGFEAHWYESGGFISRGGSFAQEFTLYYEWLKEMVYGRKNAAGLIQVLQRMPSAILQQQLIFLQNHDEDPFDLHLEWGPVVPALRPDAHRAFAAMLVLGIPGIPLLMTGQESGIKQRWNVTGNPWNYDQEWNWGRHPQAPPRPRFDAFADESPEAKGMRNAFSQIFALREADPAFWWAEGARFLNTSDPNTFAVYRSAGNKEALVLVNLKTSASGPEDVTPVTVDLSGLKLNAQEAAALRESLKKPSLVLPAAPSLEWKGDPQTETISFLEVRLRPFQVVVVEFEPPQAVKPAAAGAEELVFPAPEQTDRPAAWAVWRDGGNLYPSGGPLGTVAFVSPREGKAGVGIYASLWNLNGGGMVPEVFRLPGIPPDRPVHLYDQGRVPPGTRQEIAKILSEKVLPRKGPKENGWEEKGLDVVARLSGTRGGGDWIVPMIPIDAGAGQIRFEAWVPARPEFIGDYTVSVEVRWGQAWHRLKETGHFRIHPLHSNGRDLRVPDAREYKLWVSPTGQPVVIGWNPQWNLRKPAPSWRVPVADRPYWIRFWDGRFYLLDREQMKRFGFSHDPDRPDLWPEQPIVEAAINVDPSGGIVVIPSGEVFEDKEGTLGARLEKAFQVLGIRWSLEGFQPLPQPQAGGPHPSLERMFEQLERVGDAGSFRDFLAQWGEGGWEQMSKVLQQAPYEERDRFLHLLHQSFIRWTREDPSAPVFRVSSRPSPRSFFSSPLPMITLSLNGVLDLIWRQHREMPGQPIEETLLQGGGPLAVARASANLLAEGEVDVVALGFGESGEQLFEGLRQSGFRERPGDDPTPLWIPVEGQESRISVNGVVSSSPTVPAGYVQQAVDAVVRRMDAYGPRKGILVIGEHLVRTDHPAGSLWVAEALAGLAREARRRGWQTAVAASSSWDKKTFETILATQPDTFHLDLEPFSRLVSSEQRKLTEEDLLYLPREEVAALADQLRSRYGVERFIVSLGAAGEILVTSSGWFSAVPSPDLELTYVTGGRDEVLGVFTRLLQMGTPVKEALHEAVISEVRHMEEWGRPVTQKEVEANHHRVQVYELLQPAPSRTVSVAPAEPPSYPEAFTTPVKTEPLKLNLRKVDVLPVGAGDGIREILERLRPGEAPSKQVLIGPVALAGSDGVPPLWPLLTKLRKVLPEPEWAQVRGQVILFTQNKGLAERLNAEGYVAPSDLAELRQVLAQRTPSGMVFYMGREDWLLRGQIPGITESVQLTPENYLQALARLFELLGYLRPEPQQIEELPASLLEAA